MLGAYHGSGVLPLRSLLEFSRRLFSAASGRLGLRGVAPYRLGGMISGNLGLEPESWAPGAQLEMDMIGSRRFVGNGGRPLPNLGGQHRHPTRVPSTNPPRHTSMLPQPSPLENGPSRNSSIAKASPNGHMRSVAVDNPKVPFKGTVNPQVSRFPEDLVSVSDLLIIGSPSQPQVIEPQPQAIIDSPVHPMSGLMGNTSRMIDILAEQLPPLASTPSPKTSGLAPEPRQLPSPEMLPPPRPGLTRDQSFPPVCASLPDGLKHIVEDDNILSGKHGTRSKIGAAGDRRHSVGNPTNMGRRKAHRDREQVDYFFGNLGADPVDTGSRSRSESESSAPKGASRVKRPIEAHGSPTLDNVRPQPGRREYRALAAMIPGFQIGTPPKNTNDGEQKTRSSLSLPPPTSSSSQLPSRVNGPMGTGTKKTSQSVSDVMLIKKRKHNENDPFRGKHHGFMRGDDGETTAVGQLDGDFDLAREEMMDVGADVGGYRGKGTGVETEPESLFPADILMPFSEDHGLGLLQERFADSITADDFLFPSS